MQQYISYYNQNEACWCTYFDFTKENNKKNHKFGVDDHVRISKYKNIFATVYSPN